jgi:hypothetical protein
MHHNHLGFLGASVLYYLLMLACSARFDLNSNHRTSVGEVRQYDHGRTAGARRSMNHPAKPDLGSFGVWVRDAVVPGEAVEIEKLGDGAVWVGGSPAAELSFLEPILAHHSGSRET